jgi:hypothetical protein
MCYFYIYLFCVLCYVFINRCYEDFVTAALYMQTMVTFIHNISTYRTSGCSYKSVFYMLEQETKSLRQAEFVPHFALSPLY